MKKKAIAVKPPTRQNVGYEQLVLAISTVNTQMVGHVAAVANQALVLRNWMVGAYIVEFEQKGADRAKYGAQLLETLAEDLAKDDDGRRRRCPWSPPWPRRRVTVKAVPCSEVFSGVCGYRASSSALRRSAAGRSAPGRCRAMKLMISGVHLLGRTDQVALVLAGLVVHQHDHLAGPQVFQDVLN